MTEPTETPPAPPPPLDPPISTGRTMALGCAGFALFYAGGAILGMAFAANIGVGIVLLVILVATIVASVRGADRRARAVMGRVAVGFGIAAVIFGACIAAISNADFR